MPCPPPPPALITAPNSTLPFVALPTVMLAFPPYPAPTTAPLSATSPNHHFLTAYPRCCSVCTTLVVCSSTFTPPTQPPSVRCSYLEARPPSHFISESPPLPPPFSRPAEPACTVRPPPPAPPPHPLYEQQHAAKACEGPRGVNCPMQQLHTHTHRVLAGAQAGSRLDSWMRGEGRCLTAATARLNTLHMSSCTGGSSPGV